MHAFRAAGKSYIAMQHKQYLAVSNIVPATPDTIAQAGALIAAGKLVAFPTETVFGLGADATQGAGASGCLVSGTSSTQTGIRGPTCCWRPSPTSPRTRRHSRWPGR